MFASGARAPNEEEERKEGRKEGRREKMEGKQMSEQALPPRQILKQLIECPLGHRRLTRNTLAEKFLP